VFLNACEAGVSGEALLAVGGLVGSFLATGASGFIAPLWEVDDTEAHDIAIEFYRRTFDEGQTVGEAMRAIRSRFRATGGGSATALAYTFYGNPALQLNRSVS
jgi:CHAT domain-containing protein